MIHPYSNTKINKLERGKTKMRNELLELKDEIMMKIHLIILLAVMLECLIGGLFVWIMC